MRILLLALLSCASLFPHTSHSLSLIDFQSLYFSLDQSSTHAHLTAAQISQLAEVAQTLKLNPTLHIVVSGYADVSEGSDKECQAISEYRARLAYDWLATHDVSSQLKSHRGLGNAHPVDFTDTEEQRRRNRRVEFQVDYESNNHQGQT